MGLPTKMPIPELEETPITVPGDLWMLGDHRVLCGDATVRADVERLMASETVDLVFTDPPYNVDYEGYTEEHLKINGDRMTAEQFQQFLAATLANYRAIVKPGASLYVCHPLLAAGFPERPGSRPASRFAARSSGPRTRSPGASAATNFSTSRFSTPMSPARKMPGTATSRNRLCGRRTSRRPTGSTRQKPVELIERALVNSSKAGDVVVDLFGGSGSTLIACERARKARLMEIDPKYCDATVRRWQEYTGKQAVLDGDGRPFGVIERERARIAA